MEVVVYMVLVLLIVLLVVVLALSEDHPLSQSMNHMSVLGANHKRDNFCCHVQLTDKMYSTNFMIW